MFLLSAPHRSFSTQRPLGELQTPPGGGGALAPTLGTTVLEFRQLHIDMHEVRILFCFFRELIFLFYPQKRI